MKLGGGFSLPPLTPQKKIVEEDVAFRLVSDKRDSNVTATELRGGVGSADPDDFRRSFIPN